MELPGRTPQGVRGLKFEDMYKYLTHDKSHPARGAWIEMPSKASCARAITVAPRKGCVD